MKKSVIIFTALAMLTLVWVGCSTDNKVVGPQGNSIFKLSQGIATIWTETLGDPGIALSGSGLVIEGTGMVSQPATLDINVPGTSVEQVLLYWSGGSNAGDHSGDNTISIDGHAVVGDLIGGPANFYSTVYFSAYRADITGLGLVSNGANSFSLTDMVFPFSGVNENNGAALVVIYGDGTTADLQIRDGLDLAFFNFPEPRKTTVPQTFGFAAADVARSGFLSVVAGSVAQNRPNEIKVTINGADQSFHNILGSMDGADYDAVTIPVNIPAGATSLTVEAISTNSFDPLGASICWIVGALDIETPDEETGDCAGKVTELTVKYIGSVADANIVVKAKKKVVVFDGVVQPGEMFTIFGFDRQGTLGPETYYYVNGVLNTNIHTSCSQPIGPGLIKGDFEVIKGYSRRGGLLPPL